MTLVLFEGAAGTGKTTNVVQYVQAYLTEHPLDAEQRVLALTKYHGSRRRMQATLTGEKAHPNEVDCTTIDSFARRLVTRWRSLARALGMDWNTDDFGAVTNAAAELLGHKNVAEWVARRYPLVVVDELQDLIDGEVGILKALESHTHIVCAADDFQCLSHTGVNQPVSWARTIGEVHSLDTIHRTQSRQLLTAGHAVRQGEPLPVQTSADFSIQMVASAPQAGAIMAWKIYSWQTHGQIAVISPAGPQAPFVRDSLSWLAQNSSRGQYGGTAGPYEVNWEFNSGALVTNMIECLALPTDGEVELSVAELMARAKQVSASDVFDWLHKLRRVVGRQSVSAGEVRERVGYLMHQRRAFGRDNQWRRRAMTVHQAKNREFPSVIVLWPLQVVGDPVLRRRQLYNAITRARERAIVIVQDPVGNREAEVPFSI